ncbi:MAG: hypothetical protein ACLTYW_05145 [Collinsella sp.]
MVAAGAITVFLMPLLAQLFYRVVDAAPVAAVAEVAEHPSDALDICAPITIWRACSHVSTSC